MAKIDETRVEMLKEFAVVKEKLESIEAGIVELRAIVTDGLHDLQKDIKSGNSKVRNKRQTLSSVINQKQITNKIMCDITIILYRASSSDINIFSRSWQH